MKKKVKNKTYLQNTANSEIQISQCLPPARCYRSSYVINFFLREINIIRCTDVSHSGLYMTKYASKANPLLKKASEKQTVTVFGFAFGLSLFSTYYKYIFNVMPYVLYYFCCWCCSFHDGISSYNPNSNSILQFS